MFSTKRIALYYKASTFHYIISFSFNRSLCVDKLGPQSIILYIYIYVRPTILFLGKPYFDVIYDLQRERRRRPARRHSNQSTPTIIYYAALRSVRDTCATPLSRPFNVFPCGSTGPPGRFSDTLLTFYDPRW